MLSSRIRKHVDEQNWFAVVIDFLVVVAGILIALHIANWNESRQAARSENSLKDRLTVEFETLGDELSRRLSRAEGFIDSTSELIALIRLEEEPTNVKQVRLMLLNAARFSAAVAPPTAFSDALQAGQINSLSSTELRDALNKYVISTDWWRTVAGAALPQNDPSSRLNQAITWKAPNTLGESLSREVLTFNWGRVVKAERELVAIHRIQVLQAEAYRLELIEVQNVLATLHTD